jgi:hypothetical protein
MAKKTLESVRKDCINLETEEIERRIKQHENSRTGKPVANFYKTVLSERKPLEESKPLDLIVGEYWVILRSSALRRNKDFNLTFSDVKKLVLKKKCEYTGEEFVNITDRTCDRLDPSKGYVKGNVFAVSKKANSIKNELFENEGSVNKTTLAKMKAMINKLEQLGFE